MNSSIVKALTVAAIMGSFGSMSAATLAAETGVQTSIPGTSAGIWRAIEMHMQELHATITKGKLGTVHQHGYAVRDLVRALPAHSPNLSADALAKIAAQTKFVDTLAERLDQSGDANNTAGTEENTRKLEAILKAMRTQYP